VVPHDPSAPLIEALAPIRAVEVDKLLELARRDDLEVSKAARGGVQELCTGNPEAIRRLLDMLSDVRQDVEVLERILGMKSDDLLPVREALLGLLDHPNSAIRVSVLKSLTSGTWVDPPAAIAAARRIMEGDSAPWVRQQAVLTLRELVRLRGSKS
jgi:hypothetical protein